MTSTFDPTGPHAFAASYQNRDKEILTMVGYPQTVEITKTVPVNDAETLAVWLDQALEAWLNPRGDGSDLASAGTKALDLIKKAGFTLTPPSSLR